jgi:dolichyl-phosphate-mannose--protein O-mannosyl transferase
MSVKKTFFFFLRKCNSVFSAQRELRGLRPEFLGAVPGVARRDVSRQRRFEAQRGGDHVEAVAVAHQLQSTLETLPLPVLMTPLQGQFFSGSTYRVYLLGNPVIWWGNLVFLLIFVCVFGANAIRQQRGYIKSFSEAHKEKLAACAWLFLGWLLHYVPFWAMGRVLYFHHYFPALLFSSMITGRRPCVTVFPLYQFIAGIIVDYLLEEVPQFFNEKFGNTVYHTMVALVLSTMVYSFYLFAPLTYGMSGPNANEPNSTMYGLKWLDTWEF